MAAFTNKKENSDSLGLARIWFHPVLIGSVLAAIVLLALISKLPVDNLQAEKFHVLLTISSALMVLMLYSISKNLATRMKSEAELQKSMANLNAIIEHTDSGIYSIDTSYRYIAFNRVLYNNLKQGYGLEIKPGDHVFGFLEKLDRSEARSWRKIYSRALKGETVKFEREFDVQGVKTSLSFSIYPIWRNSAVVGLSCFVQDVTERKKSEVQKKQITADLIQRNKDLEQFSFIVSHNLRGPVANILGLSNLLKEVSMSQEEKEKARKFLFEAVERLDLVITDLNQTLEVKHNLSESKEKIIFSEIFDGVKAGMESCIEKRKAMLITDFSAAKSFYSTRSYIHSIFYNLISNSLKYARPGVPPIITIKSERKADKLFLTFRDNGLGMDTELCRDKLFGLYHRFHPETDGKGMGLFMVKTQVEAMGGKISLKSVVDKGTEFTLEFPFFSETQHVKMSA
jgi:PAS domain S-box-containing protein